MIVKDFYSTSVDNAPLFKIYSDKNFFLQSKGNLYKDMIVLEENIKDFTETNVAIPAPIANESFIYQILIGDYQNITQDQIIQAKVILNKALNLLPDEEAYKVKFLFFHWTPENQYKVGERILYNGELYNIIQTPPKDSHPEIHTDCYQKVKRPLDLIEELNTLEKKIYNAGDRVRINNYIYESTINNNVWTPREFPDMWKLVE